MANIIRITDEINNESSVIAASAKAVKTVNDKAVKAASDISQTQEELKNYLPTTGGTVNGTLNITKNMTIEGNAHIKGTLSVDVNSSVAGKYIVRSVNGVNADATGNVNVNAGVASTAERLQTARTITVQHYIAGNDGGFGITPNFYTGAGSASFDGSGNITIRVPTGNYKTNCHCDCS